MDEDDERRKFAWLEELRELGRQIGEGLAPILAERNRDIDRIRQQLAPEDRAEFDRLMKERYIAYLDSLSSWKH